MDMCHFYTLLKVCSEYETDTMLSRLGSGQCLPERLPWTSAYSFTLKIWQQNLSNLQLFSKLHFVALSASRQTPLFKVQEKKVTSFSPLVKNNCCLSKQGQNKLLLVTRFFNCCFSGTALFCQSAVITIQAVSVLCSLKHSSFVSFIVSLFLVAEEAKYYFFFI